MVQDVRPIVIQPTRDGNAFPGLCSSCPIEKTACPILLNRLEGSDALIFWGENKTSALDQGVIRLLAETGRLALTASGVCMVPAVYPGDSLVVAARPIDQVQIGEIAVFRRAGYLFGHRVIATGRDSAGGFVITRPDSSAVYDDGRIYADGLVGVVSQIGRRGKRAQDVKKIRSGFSSSLGRMISGFQTARFRFASAIRGVQNTRLYHPLAAWIQPVVLRNSTVELQTPLRAGTHLTQKISGPALQTYQLENLRLSDFSLILFASNKWISSLHFRKAPDSCSYPGWWLLDSQTRVRYDGIGLEKHLLTIAADLFLRSGIEFLRLHYPHPWLLSGSKTDTVGWQIALRGEHV